MQKPQVKPLSNSQIWSSSKGRRLDSFSQGVQIQFCLVQLSSKQKPQKRKRNERPGCSNNSSGTCATRNSWSCNQKSKMMNFLMKLDSVDMLKQPDLQKYDSLGQERVSFLSKQKRSLLCGPCQLQRMFVVKKGEVAFHPTIFVKLTQHSYHFWIAMYNSPVLGFSKSTFTLKIRSVSTRFFP